MSNGAVPDASKRLNVLFITTWYPTASAPVAGVFVREYAKAVARYDNVAVLHCPELSPDLDVPWRVEVEQDAELTAGIPTYRLRYRRSPVPKTSYLVQLTGWLPPTEESPPPVSGLMCFTLMFTKPACWR